MQNCKEQKRKKCFNLSIYKKDYQKNNTHNFNIANKTKQGEWAIHSSWQMILQANRHIKINMCKKIFVDEI